MRLMSRGLRYSCAVVRATLACRSSCSFASCARRAVSFQSLRLRLIASICKAGRGGARGVGVGEGVGGALDGLQPHHV